MTSASDDNSSYDYTFDDLGRVTAMDVDNGGPGVNLMQAYNAVGSRTDKGGRWPCLSGDGAEPQLSQSLPKRGFRGAR